MPATGPTTVNGKNVSSRNAVKHGLLSEAPVVTCIESPEEWESHRAGVLADLAPNGQMETCLAERAALLIWRLRRMAQAEICWIDDRHRDAPEKKRNHTYIPGFDAINCLTRYEAHLGRELARTMKSLKDLQSRPEVDATRHPTPDTRHPSNARTLNGSTPLRLAHSDDSLYGGAPENCETKSAEMKGSETPILHPCATPADLHSHGSTEPARESENCETNYPVELTAPHPTPAAPHAMPPAEVVVDRPTLGGSNNENYKTNPMWDVSASPHGQEAGVRKVHELSEIVLAAFRNP